MVKAKAAGDIASGYNQVYFTLAVMSAIGIALALIVKRPAQAVSE
jgi:hypothetical protein